MLKLIRLPPTKRASIAYPFGNCDDRCGRHKEAHSNCESWGPQLLHVIQLFPQPDEGEAIRLSKSVATMTMITVAFSHQW